MNQVYRFLLGYYQVYFSSPRAERILNFLLENNIPVWGIHGGENKVSFCISSYHIRFLSSFLKGVSKDENLEKKKRGTLRILELFGARFGFFAGIGFFVLSLFLSTLFLWGVDVVGNENITADKIKKDLAELGVRPGVLISSFDPKEIGMRYQISGDDFVYVNINMIGTKAYVEVREREKLEKTKEETTPSNQVAKIYGKVERYEVLSGQIQVKKGENVTKGQLLISGIIENANGTFHFLPAKGRVFARTERSFEIQVPLEEKVRVFTGVEKEKVTLEILGIKIPLFLIEPGDKETFKRLESTEEITLFGRALPIRKNKVLFLETKEKIEPIILDRARDLAYDKYNEFKRDTFAPDDEILEEKLSFSEEKNRLILTVEIVAMENICKEAPFFVN